MDIPDCYDMVMADQGEYMVATNKGILTIDLDEEFNIIYRHNRYFKDKEVRCINKIKSETFLVGI